MIIIMTQGSYFELEKAKYWLFHEPNTRTQHRGMQGLDPSLSHNKRHSKMYVCVREREREMDMDGEKWERGESLYYRSVLFKRPCTAFQGVLFGDQWHEAGLRLC
jgi:hypothetical protein